jgi:hypothetical protein
MRSICTPPLVVVARTSRPPALAADLALHGHRKVYSPDA